MVSFCVPDVVNRVRNGESIPFRPQLPESSELGKQMLDLIRNSWNENSEHRPTFQQIRSTLRKMTNGESVFSSSLVCYTVLSFPLPLICYLSDPIVSPSVKTATRNSKNLNLK